MNPIEYLKPSQIRVDPGNVYTHADGDIQRLTHSIQEHGFLSPLVVDAASKQGLNGEASYELVGGEARLEAAKICQLTEIPCTIATFTDKKQRDMASIALNSSYGAWDDTKLATLLQDLQSQGADLDDAGLPPFQLDELLEGLNEPIPTPDSLTLAERFGVPPFSVLDARQGYWQGRKRAWIDLGIRSELGRGDSPSTSARAMEGETPTYRQIGNRPPSNAPGGSLRDAATLGKNGKTVRGVSIGREVATAYQSQPKLTALQKGKTNRLAPGGTGHGTAWLSRGDDGTFEGQAKGKRLTWVTGNRPDGELDETSRKNLAASAGAKVFGTEGNASEQTGTSIFDPVLCEIAYRWFCPPAGHILDPFAGGSVRGIVAAKLGRSYIGIDLRAEQVEANEQQVASILKKDEPAPKWIVGDSLNVNDLCPDIQADFLFTCPPYFDLERYSDDPADLSNAGEYTTFLASYRLIITRSAAKLKDNRFAAIVVGDIRDKKGLYRNFVSDTIDAFHDAGMKLYNEAILVTAVGSLSIRTSRSFPLGRKLGKTHQNVLVFVKGDPKKATVECGTIEVYVPDEDAA